jgi:hypothetical protein
VCAQAGDDFDVVLGAFSPSGFDDLGDEACRAGSGYASGIASVGKDDGDLGVGQTPLSDTFSYS